jgi:hypothetical protein
MKKKYETNADRQQAYRDRLKVKQLEEKNKNIEKTKPLLELGIIDFFRKVTGLEPTEKQKLLLMALDNPDLFYILISAGRQTGKSLCCAVAAVYLTLKNKIQICLVSAKENYVYQHIQDIFSNNPSLRSYVSWEGRANVIPKDGYDLKNGSRVLLLVSTEKGIRGASAQLIFLDEAELMDSQTVSTAYGNVSGQKIKLVILGTPSSQNSKFNELLKNPKKYGFTLFTWSELECNWHTEIELEHKKRILTDDEWLRDVEGKLVESDVKLLWNLDTINKAVKETVLTEGGRREAGIDGGGSGIQGRDRLGLVIIERIGKTRIKVLHTQTWNFDSLANAPTEISNILKIFNVEVVKIDSLPVYWTEIIQDHFNKDKVFPVTFKAYKEEMQGKFTHTLESQQIEIPMVADELILQMKKYKKQGNPHYDDLVDGLLLACYWNDALFKIKPKGTMIFLQKNMKNQGSYGYIHPFKPKGKRGIIK